MDGRLKSVRKIIELNFPREGLKNIISFLENHNRIHINLSCEELSLHSKCDTHSLIDTRMVCGAPDYLPNF